MGEPACSRQLQKRVHLSVEDIAAKIAAYVHRPWPCPGSGLNVAIGTTPEQRVWTAAEARQFLDALADDRLIALWTLALRTGMRRGELAALLERDTEIRRDAIAL